MEPEDSGSNGLSPVSKERVLPTLSNLLRSPSNSPERSAYERGTSPPRRPKTPQRPQLQDPESPARVSGKKYRTIPGILDFSTLLPDLTVSVPSNTAKDPSIVHEPPVRLMGPPRNKLIVEKSAPVLSPIPELKILGPEPKIPIGEPKTPSPVRGKPDLMELVSPLENLGIAARREGAPSTMTIKTDTARSQSLLSPFSPAHGSPMDIDTAPPTQASTGLGSPMDIDNEW